MRRFLTLAGAVTLALGPLVAEAGDFDGTRLLICAPVQAFDCDAEEDCVKGTPGSIGAPAFIRIDVPNKVVVGPKRTSPIHFTEKSERQLLLQGTELGYGWTMVLDQETGKLTATLADREGVFVLFGACLAP